MKEEDQRACPMMDRRTNLCVTSVTILDTLQEIVEHLRIRMELIKEEMHLYVSYVITSDTQQDIAEWTKGTLTGIQIIEGTTTK